MRKSLHNLLVAYHFLNERRLFRPVLALARKHGMRASGNEARNKKRKRREYHYGKRYRRIHAEHEYECAYYGKYSGKKLAEAQQQSVRKLVHVRNYAAHRLAVRMRVYIAERQLHQPVERFRAHVLNNVIGHGVVYYVHQPLRKRGYGRNNGYFGQLQHNLGVIHAARGNYVVYRPPGQYGYIQRKPNVYRAQQYAEHRVQPVTRYAPKHLFKR